MNQSIGLFIPETTVGHTAGKFLYFGKVLQRAGYDVTILCWNDKVAIGAKENGLPYCQINLTQVQVNRVEEAQKVHALLDKPIVGQKGAPTWGDLLAFDDFVGMAAGIKIDGMGAFQPQCLVGSLNGMEEATFEDEQMRLALWRWARANKIPQLGIEVQEIDSGYSICQWPVDMALTRVGEPCDVAPIIFPLSPAYQYLCSVRNQPQVERFLEMEDGMRKQLNWEPGVYYLLLPFHIYYIDGVIKMLQALTPLASQFKDAGIKLVMTCGASAYRRGMYEQDIISKGLAKWLQPFGEVHIIAGASIIDWVWLAEGVLAPYPHSMFNVFRGMGARVFPTPTVDRLKDLLLYVRPQEAVAWLLQGGNK